MYPNVFLVESMRLTCSVVEDCSSQGEIAKKRDLTLEQLVYRDLSLTAYGWRVVW